MTAKMATIVRDVTGLQQCHHSAKYTSFSCKDQRLSTEGKIVSKYCNISKTLLRGPINPPPLYYGGGMNVRGLTNIGY